MNYRIIYEECISGKRKSIVCGERNVEKQCDHLADIGNKIIKVDKISYKDNESIFTFSEDKYNSSCLICNCKDNVCQLIINRLLMSDSVTSFAICRSCLSKMYFELHSFLFLDEELLKDTFEK